MEHDSTGAGRVGAAANGSRVPKAKRPGNAGSRKGEGERERMRVSYRFAVETWQRIGIHCRLARVDEHAFVERAVLALLRQVGKGQDVFESRGERLVVLPDTPEDRQSETAA